MMMKHYRRALVTGGAVYDAQGEYRATGDDYRRDEPAGACDC